MAKSNTLGSSTSLNAAEPILFAVVRSEEEKELFWRSAFVACDSGRKGSPKAVFERHRLKGHKEQLFSEVLNFIGFEFLPHSQCQMKNAQCSLFNQRPLLDNPRTLYPFQSQSRDVNIILPAKSRVRTLYPG